MYPSPGGGGGAAGPPAHKERDPGKQRVFPVFLPLAKEEKKGPSPQCVGGENTLSQPPWAASASPQTGEGELKGGTNSPLYFSLKLWQSVHSTMVGLVSWVPT